MSSAYKTRLMNHSNEADSKPESVQVISQVKLADQLPSEVSEASLDNNASPDHSDSNPSASPLHIQLQNTSCPSAKSQNAGIMSSKTLYRNKNQRGILARTDVTTIKKHSRLKGRTPTHEASHTGRLTASKFAERHDELKFSFSNAVESHTSKPLGSRNRILNTIFEDVEEAKEKATPAMLPNFCVQRRTDFKMDILSEDSERLSFITMQSEEEKVDDSSDDSLVLPTKEVEEEKLVENQNILSPAGAKPSRPSRIFQSQERAAGKAAEGGENQRSSTIRPSPSFGGWNQTPSFAISKCNENKGALPLEKKQAAAPIVLSQDKIQFCHAPQQGSGALKSASKIREMPAAEKAGSSKYRRCSMIQTKSDIREIIRKNAQFYNSKKDLFAPVSPMKQLGTGMEGQAQPTSSGKRIRMEKQRTEFEVTRFNLLQEYSGQKGTVPDYPAVQLASASKAGMTPSRAPGSAIKSKQSPSKPMPSQSSPHKKKSSFLRLEEYEKLYGFVDTRYSHVE